MTLWRNLVVALVAAFALAACSSSDSGGTASTETEAPAPSGPTQEELDAANERADAAEQELQEEKDKQAAEEDAAELAAMVATAAKLYAGIGNAPLTSTGDGQRSAAYTGTDDANITLTYDPDLTTAGDTAVTRELTEDEDAMVADNYGWEGKRYTRTTPAAEGTYEAVVYSNVEAPTRGKKFGGAAANDEFEYGLTNGALAVDTSSTTAYVPRVGGSNFDHSAGVKTFALPTPNPNLETVVTVAGTFHGVSGTFSCTPGATAICAVNVASEGFQLGTVASATDNTFANGGGTWMFTPSDANARVMESADTNYASYGWWLHKAANDGAFIASAFVDDKGADLAIATGVDALNGSATYEGGAAGKYALASSTGGTNDAGHFTAKAKLEANFNDDTITGTIYRFHGADDMERDWSVKLMKSHIGDNGALIGTPDGTTDATAAQMTEWTIGGTAAADSGQWSGSLRNEGDDGVPEVAVGTFYTEYGTAGRMVGAFGANVQ